MGKAGKRNKHGWDKKDHQKKEIARERAAKALLAKDGKEVTQIAVKAAVKELQGKHKVLQSRISKKKERQIAKQITRTQKETLRKNTAMDIDSSLPSSKSIPESSSIVDVEMKA